MNKKSLLLIVIILGFILRVIFINSSPPSLYGDELTIALDANSILKTGHDQLGNFLPLTFQMGAGRPAGYVYFSIPFIAIFGPSVLGVRSLSIFSAIGIIYLIYLLGKRLFSEKLGLIASGLMAISPWDISLSRGGFEAHFALFLSLFGLYLFIKAKKKPKLYILSALSFGLTLHTYPTYKVSLILFLPLLVWFQGIKDILVNNGRKYFITGAIILLIVGGLALSQTFIAGSETRFSDINILSQTKLKDSIEQKINLERSITELPDPFSKYFHSKPVEYTKVLIENYVQNFSIDFLILHGDRNPRHNMATMGELYAVDAVLILIGLLGFWIKQKKDIIFLIFWILLAPIPTAMVDLPHALRSAFMLPPLIILSSLGLYTIINQKNRLPFFLTGFFLIIQFIFFIQKLYFLSPNEYSKFWSYSAMLASEKAISEHLEFDTVILSDRIDNVELAYPLYAKIDPSEIINQNQNKVRLAGIKAKKFGNVYIANIADTKIQEFISELKERLLYIGPNGDAKYLKDFETLEGKDRDSILVIKKLK